MTNFFVLPKHLILLGLIPIAVFVGYLLSSPSDVDSVAIIGLFLMILAIPLMLKWHHSFLVLSWNASIIIFFLPGAPSLWMVVGGISLGLTLLSRFLDKNRRLLSVPAVGWTLLLFGLVVFLTAQVTGGVGLRSMGGGVYGGKKYFYIWFAIIAYFGLSIQALPKAKARFYSEAFFLSGMTAVLSNLVYIAGPAAWFLYAIFPVEIAISQAVEDLAWGFQSTGFSRIGGLSSTALAAFCFLIIRYGVRGTLDWSKPWRIVLLLLVISTGLWSGFRSALALYALIFAVQFVNEGLLKTRLFPTLMLVGSLGYIAMFLFVQKMPLSVQRSLSLLPLPVTAVAKFDAQSSTEWRLQMWRVLAPEIPQYFWLGKGFTASPTDYYLAQESVRRGFSRDYETMILAGDYHNGPLSILVPFGIWGVLAFVAFCIGALRVLYFNQRYGAPVLEKVNTFLLSYFIAKLIYFSFVFGAIHIDLATFAGLVGLSVSLNGGMLRKKTEVQAIDQAHPTNKSQGELP